MLQDPCLSSSGRQEWLDVKNPASLHRSTDAVLQHNAESGFIFFLVNTITLNVYRLFFFLFTLLLQNLLLNLEVNLNFKSNKISSLMQLMED